MSTETVPTTEVPTAPNVPSCPIDAWLARTCPNCD